MSNTITRRGFFQSLAAAAVGAVVPDKAINKNHKNTAPPEGDYIEIRGLDGEIIGYLPAADCYAY